MNWLVVAAVVSLVSLVAFIVCLIPRRWTAKGFWVGVANLFLVLLNSAAPIRGWADPEYVGFSFGLIEVGRGPIVTLVSGSMLFLATFSACVAALNLRGSPMRVVALFDGLMALNFGIGLAIALIRDPGSMRIQLGEYLTIGPLVAGLIFTFALVLPLALSAVWAWRRAKA